MTLTDIAPSKPAPAKAKTLLIDTDVHENLGSYLDLLPYLDPVWHRFIKNEGSRWHGLIGSAYPMPINRARPDWVLADGTYAVDPKAAAKHLFEDLGVTTAILNGFFHVTRLEHDYEFAQAMARAYNDWQIDRWLSTDKRFRGSVHIVMHDPIAAAKEIDRVAKNPQIVQVFIPTYPNRQYGDPMYRPIYEAAVRNGLALTLHHGSETPTILGYPRYFIEWHTLASPQAHMGQLTSLLFNGTFDAFPDLKLVILESDVGWLPWLTKRMDQHYRELRSNVPWLKHKPSHYVRNNVRFSTQPLNDITAAEFAEMIEKHGLEDVYMFSTDYPHWDSEGPEVIQALPEALRNRVRYQNALATFPRLADLKS